jgi:hypothetical protein
LDFHLYFWARALTTGSHLYGVSPKQLFQPLGPTVGHVTIHQNHQDMEWAEICSIQQEIGRSVLFGALQGFQSFGIGQISGSSRGFFVANEVVEGGDMHFDSLDIHRQGPFERILKLKPGRCGNNVYPPWSDSDLKDSSIPLKVFPGQTAQRGAESTQCLQDRFGVLLRGHDPNVNVHGSPGITVGRHGVSAHEKKPNLLVGQCL